MDFLDFQMLGNTVKSYLMSLGLFVLAVLGATVANRFLKKRIMIWAEKTATELDDLIITHIFAPVTYFILIIGVALAKSHLN